MKEAKKKYNKPKYGAVKLNHNREFTPCKVDSGCSNFTTNYVPT